MAGSVNRVIIIGNVGADPEVRSFDNGGKIANLRVATSEQWKDKQTGERRERTEWHNVVARGDGLVGVIDRYVKKGSKVYIEGQLQTRKWTDRDGNDRYSTDVVIGMDGKLTMLDSPSGDGGQRGGGFGGQPPKKPEQQSWGDDLEDDVPFMSCDMRYEGRVS